MATDRGPLRGLRNGIWRLLTGRKHRGGRSNKGKIGPEGSLPVDVPPRFQTELRGKAGRGAAAASAQEVEALALELNVTNEEKKLYERANTHSSHLFNGLLFPSNTTDGTHRNPFAILTHSDSWH